MKKLLAFAVAILLSFSVYAQDKEKKMDKMHASMKDCVMMHDGKMMVMKGGKMTAMTEDMTLKNGTMIMKDGTVMMKDGTNKPLKEGEGVYMDGTMGKMDMDMKKHKAKKSGTR
ncbi:DUF6799 domain-containing protein [Dyadobacter sp. BHUBP1]|uniref:DUF6799 domain-containing protein n=1 Tax=Dyadobacter sp. BHUBP1 TaxID=3424178 RepID=UPI003D3511AB